MAKIYEMHNGRLTFSTNNDDDGEAWVAFDWDRGGCTVDAFCGPRLTRKNIKQLVEWLTDRLKQTR